jgi:hypothetical protein
MDDERRIGLWRQFGGAIDMLEGAMAACPEYLWADNSRQPPFWRLAYHTLFWLDLYLYGSTEGFAPPAPFKLEELDPAGLAPERLYSKDELQNYLEYCREKCRSTIGALTAEKAASRKSFVWGEVSFEELLIYNLRHVQHGAAQMNLILRQTVDTAARWVGMTKRQLYDR